MNALPGVDARHYAADEILRDGSSIRIRAIRPDDKQRLVDHFNGLSARSVYFRFFRSKKRLTDEELTEFTELDFVDRVARLAPGGADDGEQIIGVGRYAVIDAVNGGTAAQHGCRRAEVAFAVADAYQGRGVGTLLLEHLAPLARASGIV